MTRPAVEAVLSALRGEQFKPTVVLSVATFVQLSWKYFGSPAFFEENLVPFLEGWRGYGGLYCFLCGFVLLGLVPALVVKLVLRESLADYGVRLGIASRTLRTLAVFGPLFVLGGWLASLDPAVQQYYPINKLACTSPAAFGAHAAGYFLYYLGWEFQFRGFLQHGLRGRLGDASAVLVQAMAAGLLHIGTPASEAFSSVAGSLLWGMIAFRTRSLLSGLLQHFALGISLDWFLCRR